MVCFELFQRAKREKESLWWWWWWWQCQWWWWIGRLWHSGTLLISGRHKPAPFNNFTQYEKESIVKKVMTWLWHHDHDIDINNDDYDESEGSRCRAGSSLIIWHLKPFPRLHWNCAMRYIECKSIKQCNATALKLCNATISWNWNCAVQLSLKQCFSKMQCNAIHM